MSNILPNEYLKLKYIASTGTQWIDTDKYCTADDIISVTGKFNTFTTGHILGCHSSGTYRRILIYPVNDIFKFVVTTGYWNESNNGASAAGCIKDIGYPVCDADLERHTFTYQFVRNSLTIDDTEYPLFNGLNDSSSNRNWPSPIELRDNTMVLFGYRHDSTYLIYSIADFQMESCTITQQGVVTREFQPALRLSDMKPGLYDFISNSFFVNGSLTGADFEYELDNYKTLITPTDDFTDIKNNYQTYLYLPNVPTGYTRLEYIQATGTQYLDCGIKFDLTNRIDIGYEMTNPSGDLSMFAVGVLSLGQKYAGHRTWDNGSNLVFFINYGARKSMPLTANTKYDVIFNRQPDHKVIVNDVELATLGTNYINPGNNMFIFAEDTVIQGVQLPWGFAKAKLYYFSMYNSDGTALYNLIPAKRNSDNVIGMWDATKNVFLTNAGTGTFIAGPEIIDDYIYKIYNTVIRGD